MKPQFISVTGERTVKTAIQIVFKINHLADLYLSNGGGWSEFRFLHWKMSLDSPTMTC